MSNLTFFDLENPGTPREGRPLPERPVDGDPRLKTWDITKTDDRVVTAWIWEVTPGASRSIKGRSREFCTILSGISEIMEDGKPTRRIGAGDSFLLEPGFESVWRVVETTRKIWVQKD